MGTTYTKADGESVRFINGVMKFHHQELSKAGVTLDVLFAGNDKGVAIKKNGFRVLGQIRKNSLAERAAGSADARLTIDGEWWEAANRQDRTALIDHELTHLELPDGRAFDDGVKRDDLGRPVLQLRNHDFEVGGFYEVIERNGVRAVEGQSIARIKSKMEQLEFNWEEAEVIAAHGSESETELVAA